jgi:hypothetical protein
MGFFEFLPFLLGALIPGLCMLSVVVLAMTRWRSSSPDLSITSLSYGILYAYLIDTVPYSASGSPCMDCPR